MSQTCAERDLLQTGKALWLLWGLPVAAILITGLLIENGWIMTITWTLSLLVMGIACILNARGCGRVHCYFTGPFLLLMAAVVLLHGLQIISLGPNGWSYLGTTLLIGATLLCLVPELIWGRYRE